MANPLAPLPAKLERSSALPALAVVTDIVMNEEHRDFLHRGVGAIRFKYLDSATHKDTPGTANYASPQDVAVQEFPLVGEIVSIQNMFGANYYFRRININKKLQFNSFSSRMFDFLSTLIPKGSDHVPGTAIAQNKDNIRHYSLDEPEEILGNQNYLEKLSLHTLKHFDGDVIIQNRYGATLRFGSSQSELALNQQISGPVSQFGPSHNPLGQIAVLGPTKPQSNDPIIIMRVGERETPNTTHLSGTALVVEDINEDLSSFVLSTAQSINFKFASNDDVFFRSSNKLNKSPMSRDADKLTALTGNQSILNSGRLVLNAKTDNIILSAKQDFISLTDRDTVLDTGEDFVIGGRQIHLLATPAQLPDKYSEMSNYSAFFAKHIVTEEEPLHPISDLNPQFTVALAENVIQVFRDLIDALMSPNAYMDASSSPVGPNSAADALPLIRATLGDIRSALVKIEK